MFLREPQLPKTTVKTTVQSVSQGFICEIINKRATVVIRNSLQLRLTEEHGSELRVPGKSGILYCEQKNNSNSIRFWTAVSRRAGRATPWSRTLHLAPGLPSNPRRHAHGDWPFEFTRNKPGFNVTKLYSAGGKGPQKGLFPSPPRFLVLPPASVNSSRRKEGRRAHGAGTTPLTRFRPW